MRRWNAQKRLEAVLRGWSLLGDPWHPLKSPKTGEKISSDRDMEDGGVGRGVGVHQDGSAAAKAPDEVGRPQGDGKEV